MDNLTFGITMVIVGMGGTLFTLWFLTLLINIMNRIGKTFEKRNDAQV